MPSKRILSVGQCAADHWMIERALREHFDVEITPAETSAEAIAELQQQPATLVLINRIFDADGASGLDLIRRLQADERLKAVPVMLISNYEDAQEEAVRLGAAKGFGKAALGQPAMIERIGKFVK